MDIVSEVKKREKELIKFRREFHKMPEIGLETPETAKFIKKILEENNIEYENYINNNGVVAVIDSGKEGKCLGIRTDMDALEIKEETDLPFKSTNGYMHACGHDSHMAGVLITLLILNDNKDKFRGKVKFIFQPGEEYPGGAELMIKEGVLENPRVDAIVALHAGGIFPEVPKGKIGVKNGKLMASMDKFHIEVLGQGGHGSTPEDTIDPIPVLCDIVQGINKIKSREIPLNEHVTISVCKIQAGFNQNIIPSNGEIEGTVRTYNDEIRSYIRDRIGEIVKSYTLGNRCDYKFSYSWKYPYLENNEEITEKLRNSVKKVLGEEDLYEIESMSMAGEDMSYYLREIPGTFFTLSNLQEDKDGKTYPNHNSKFDLDENLLWKGVAVFIQFALDFLN